MRKKTLQNVKSEYFLSVIFILLIISPATLAFGQGKEGGGGATAELDYENPDEAYEKDPGYEEDKPQFKEIDFESYDKPIEYTVALWLNNVGKIDKEAGVYELDFYYIVESEDVNFLEVGPPPVAFINSKTVKSDSAYTEEHYHEERIRGIFFNTLTFDEYPFEKLELTVEVEPDMPFHVDNAVFIVGEELSGIDPIVNVVGWELRDPTFEVVDHSYENWYDFSKFTTTIHIERSFTGALMKTFLPVTIIAGLSLLIFFIPENYTPRIYLTAPLLLALVFLHRGALGELPTLSHMTIFDKVMVIYYAIMANSIISLAIQMRIHILEKNQEKIKKVNKIMLMYVPILVSVLVLILFGTG